MSSRANGYFEAHINSRAYRQTPEDRELIASITQLLQSVVPGSQVRWAGSQHKGTAIAGSDLDMVLESRDPVTEAQRREVRTLLERRLGRPAQVLSHAVRLPAHAGRPRVDLAFAHAAFGSRPLPDRLPFSGHKARQSAVRAIKLWSGARPLPRLSGWAIEALVVHLDATPGSLTPLELFLRILGWLEERATPAAVEGVLRPAAFPHFRPEWSQRLPGTLEAVRNQAKAQRNRCPLPESWQAAGDVALWLGR